MITFLDRFWVTMFGLSIAVLSSAMPEQNYILIIIFGVLMGVSGSQIPNILNRDK